MKFVENIEAPASAITLEFVAGVGDGLKFVQHEAGHDEFLIDDARFADVGDAAVNDGGGVENEGCWPLSCLANST